MATRVCFWMVIAALLVVGSVSQGAAYVDELQFSWEVYGGIPWYNAATKQLVVPGTPTAGSYISITGTTDFDYEIAGCQVSMISDMVSDSASSGGKAEAEFAGEGVIIEVSGTFWNSTLYTSPGADPDSYNGVVFRGAMTFAAPETTWTVTEDNFTHDFSGTTQFAIDSSVGLGAGLATADGLLKMGDFTGHFTFFNSDNVSNFHTSNIVCKDLMPLIVPASAALQISAVPEPATLALLAAGTCGLFWRRRKA